MIGDDSERPIRYDRAMASDGSPMRLAVLIDGDNTSHRIADGLFEELATIGEASVRRIYGDFSNNHLRSWAEILSRHAIIAQQQFAYTTGKNSSDIALVIDAMDLLHTGRFDGFCLVTSDSDFTRLAARIREQGLYVYGVGEQKTPESLRQACHRFIYAENLLPEAPAAGREPAEAASPLQPPSAAAPLIRKAIALMDDDDGWVNLGGLGQRLANLAPDFDPRTYGHTRLGDLVKHAGGFEVERMEGRGLKARVKPVRSRRSK